MDNNDNRNNISDEEEQRCDNTEKLQADEEIKLQKKCTEQVKRKHSPCSSTDYDHKEDGRKLRRKNATHENPKAVSMEECTEQVKRKESPCCSTNYEHTHENQNEVSTSATEMKSTDSSSKLRSGTYKKRVGTTDQGKDYEKLMCALFALKFSTSDIVADFKMKTNSDDCGDFDDVALKVTFVDGQRQRFLLQLKHSEKIKDVTLEMLENKKNKKKDKKAKDYSILKHEESVRKINSKKNVSFILYTNNSTNIKSNSTIYLQNRKGVVRELQDLDPKKLLLMNSTEIRDKKEGTKVFQFELNQSSGSVESLDDFLKRFYFFAQQTNTTGARLSINAMLREVCGINDAIYSSSFIEFMETWWSGNFKLFKYDVVVKLAELTLTPFIQTISDTKCEHEKNKKPKFLREAIMKFDMTIVRDTNEEIIANIWNETASDDEIRLASLKYELCPNGSNDLSPKERSKVLWYLNKVPLIVKAEECHEEQVKHAIRLLEKVEKKKKVVLLANATKEDFPGWNIFQDLSDLPNEGIYTDIIEHFKVSLQGRDTICLDQLLNFDQKNRRTIETSDLIKMTQQDVQVGKNHEKALENYIPRNVSCISLDINKMPEFCNRTDSLVIICNFSQPWNEAIRQWNLQVMELDQYLKSEERKTFTKVHVLLTSKSWRHVQFDDICNKTERNVQLLQVFNDKSCTSVLSKKDRFMLETMKLERARVDEMEIFTYFDHPLNVICSPPGMGKSTLVSSLSSNCPFSYWSVRVNLINHQTVFKNECSHDEILHHFVEDEKDPLVVKIRSMLLQDRRMYFFLDGLDEIDSDCLQIALDFIKHISSLGHRIWITSRENLEQTVSRSLNIFPIKIEELTKEQQKKYIQERLQDIYEQDEVKQITNQIFENVDIVNSRHLLGVPLQLFIVTENFRDNKNLSRESDQEIFLFTKMYKIFFQGKKKHQLRKVGVYQREDQMGYSFDWHLKRYELPALKSCLDATTFAKLRINLNETQIFLEELKAGDPFGIVSGVTDDNQAIFNHQTYAEYFACAWMKNNLDKVSLLRDDLFTKKNQNLKFIFDIMLAENSALHLAVIYRQSNLVEKHLDKREVKDEGGRSPLQLLCTYGVEHPLLRIEENSIYSTNNVERVSAKYREIFKILSCCDVFQNDSLFRWNCLDYAIRSHNLFAVENFLEEFGDSINLETLFERYDTATLAYYSSQMGYPNLLLAVIRNDRNALSVKIEACKLTLLHVAIIGFKKNYKFVPPLVEQSIKVITKLIESGLDVDKQCYCKRTALHLASELDDHVIVRFLLERGANINLTDEKGRNALHFALENSKINVEIIKLLADKGINAETSDYEEITPLHLCCRKGLYDALVILLNSNANVNAKDSINYSILHEAVFGGNYNCVRELLDRGADINGVCDFGKTVLHAAFEKGSSPVVEVIQLLLDRGVDANKRDEFQNTALDLAALFHASDHVVKILLDKTARDQLTSTDCLLMFLHFAVYHGNYSSVELFLNRTPDLDRVVINIEEYPLYFAVDENNHLRSDLLLEMTKFIRDSQIKNRKEIVELLKNRFPRSCCSHHVRLTLRDRERFTPRDNVSITYEDYLSLDEDYLQYFTDAYSRGREF